MHGSTSPAKKGLPVQSHPRQVPSQSHPRHLTRSRTTPTERRGSSLAGSRPSSRSSDRTCMVESHPRFHAAPAHDPSAPCRASSRAPAPAVATRARSAATSSAGAPIRSRITCQRIEGSESSSHCMTDLFGFGACRWGGVVAICWCSLLWLKDAVGSLTSVTAKEDEIGPNEHRLVDGVTLVRLPTGGNRRAHALRVSALLLCQKAKKTSPLLSARGGCSERRL